MRSAEQQCHGIAISATKTYSVSTYIMPAFVGVSWLRRGVGRCTVHAEVWFLVKQPEKI